MKFNWWQKLLLPFCKTFEGCDISPEGVCVSKMKKLFGVYYLMGNKFIKKSKLTTIRGQHFDYVIFDEELK